MGLVRNRLTRRSRTLGVVSDLAVIAATGRRLVQRSRVTSSGGVGEKAELGQLVLAAGATFRILRRLRRRRKSGRVTTSA